MSGADSPAYAARVLGAICLLLGIACLLLGLAVLAAPLYVSGLAVSGAGLFQLLIYGGGPALVVGGVLTVRWSRRLMAGDAGTSLQLQWIIGALLVAAGIAILVESSARWDASPGAALLGAAINVVVFWVPLFAVFAGLRWWCPRARQEER